MWMARTAMRLHLNFIHIWFWRFRFDVCRYICTYCSWTWMTCALLAIVFIKNNNSNNSRRQSTFIAWFLFRFVLLLLLLCEYTHMLHMVRHDVWWSIVYLTDDWNAFDDIFFFFFCSLKNMLCESLYFARSTFSLFLVRCLLFIMCNWACAQCSSTTKTNASYSVLCTPYGHVQLKVDV